MSINEMDSKIKELRELRRMADELAAEMETIQDSIKAHMDAEGVDTIRGRYGHYTGLPPRMQGGFLYGSEL